MKSVYKGQTVNPPFTTEQFFSLMAQYNLTVWPTQLLLNLFALVTLAILIWRPPFSDRLIAAFLAMLWTWTGVAYHLIFFTTINKAAFGFAAIFLGGAAAFLWAGVIKRKLVFASASAIRRTTGFILVAFSLAIYPLLSYWFGHAFPTTPTFGLPCPTTLFTIGLLCFLATPYPRYVFVAPLLWSIIGSQAAFLFGVYQDLSLLVAAAIGLILTVTAKASTRPSSEHKLIP